MNYSVLDRMMKQINHHVKKALTVLYERIAEKSPHSLTLIYRRLVLK